MQQSHTTAGGGGETEHTYCQSWCVRACVQALPFEVALDRAGTGLLFSPARELDAWRGTQQPWRHISVVVSGNRPTPLPVNETL